MIIETALFYIFSFVLVASALMVVVAKNPVHSVLFLIFGFFNAAGLFVLLGAEFVAMLMVIVYVGAVAVLFLFVVMMMNINFAALKQGFIRYLPIAALISLAILAELILVVQHSGNATLVPGALTFDQFGDKTNTEALGGVLYTHYIYPFQLAGLILLVAMIGAIVLTLRAREGVKRQNVVKQVSRTREESIEIVSFSKDHRGGGRKS